MEFPKRCRYFYKFWKNPKQSNEIYILQSSLLEQFDSFKYNFERCKWTENL